MRRSVWWLVPLLALAAFITVVRLRTYDSVGHPRIRTAPQVWAAVPRRLDAMASGLPLEAVYAIALSVTVAACFLLLWSASRVREGGALRRSARTDVWRAWLELRSGLGQGSSALVTRRVCLAGMIALAVVVAWRLGAFVFESPQTRLPDGFASIDHPFHVSRAELLRQSLLGGEPLRWIASHQGGYPVEFYPLGFAYGVVLLWMLFFGLVALPIVHKLAVIGLFLAPAVVYWRMALRDGWPPAVPLSAFALHIAVPGGMWHGGYSELVYMGLVSNVSAAVAVVSSIRPMTDALTGGSLRSIVWASAAAAAALWCNPRSGIGLAACAAGVWLAAAAVLPTWRGRANATIRLAAIASLAAVLAAPELVSLARFGNLYYFIHFTDYSTITDYLTATIEAVSLPVFPLVFVGLAVAWIIPAERTVARASAIAAVLYVIVTLVFTFGEGGRAIQQLETTRLMPVQRLLMIYLAALGLYGAGAVVAARLRRTAVTGESVQLVAVGAILAAWLTPSALVPEHVSSPSQLSRSGGAGMQAFENAVRAASAAAPRDSAILVAGSSLSSHQQLWAPMVSNRLFFYDNWMWYWHLRHAGPYDPRTDSKYDPTRLDEVFSSAYFERHGIGAVVATGDAALLAATESSMIQVWGGTYNAYLAARPAHVVTVDGVAPDDVSISNHRIAVRMASAGGDLLIRRNWFPRWRATVNGHPAAVERTDDGYMRVPVGGGPANVTLEYALLKTDIAARAAAAAGVALCLVLLVVSRMKRPPRRGKRS